MNKGGRKYERGGYALTGETRPFPMGDERFGLPKTDLEFVVRGRHWASRE
ncbi:hypothetical protein [Persicitalea sp.]